MVDWPDSFPAPLLEDYSINPTDRVARTKMESGIARSRLRFTSIPTRVIALWRFDAATFRWFEAWFRFKANYGAAWFNMDIASGNSATNPLQEVRFVAPYTATLVADNLWEVNATLEVRELATATEQELDDHLMGRVDLTTVGDLDALELACNKFHDIIHRRIVPPNGNLNWRIA